MQPFQCDLQPEILKHPITTHTHKQTQSSFKPPLHCGKKKGKPAAAATAAQTRYLSSPAAATLHGKIQGFVPRLPPQNYPHATFMQPFQRDLQPQLQITHRTAHIDTTTCCRTQRYLASPAAATWHWKTQGFVLRLPPQLTTCLRHHFTSSPLLPIVTTSHHHHLASSPLPFLTTSHRHHFPSSPPPFVHFPSSPLPFLTTSHRPHLPSSPLPFIITSHRHHFPSSPLPFLTISHRPHLPSSPLPFIITSHRHHFPSSPLPFLTISHRPHLPSSPLPFIITSHRHHFPSSPLPIVTTSHRHHLPSSAPSVIASLLYVMSHPSSRSIPIDSYSFVMYCYVMYCYVMYHPSSRSIP